MKKCWLDVFAKVDTQSGLEVPRTEKKGSTVPQGIFFSCLLSSSFREDSVLNLETTHDLKKKNEHKNETRRVNFWMHDQLKKICYVVVVLFKIIFISQCSTGCFSNFRLT